MPIAQLVSLLRSFIDGSRTWAQAMAAYPIIRTGDEGEEEEEKEGDKPAKGPTVVEKTPRGKFSRPAEAAGAAAGPSSSFEGQMAGMAL